MNTNIMKSIADIILESKKDESVKYINESEDFFDVEVTGKTGQNYSMDIKSDNVKVSPNAQFIEIGWGAKQFINFYSKADIEDIDDNEDMNGKLIKKCEKMTFGKAFITPNETIFVCLKK